MSRARALGLLATIALASSAPVSAAEPTPSEDPVMVHLDYQREPGAGACVSPEQLTGDVEARLGRRVFSEADGAELVARVRARRAGRRFVVEIELFDREQRYLGRRELSTGASHCSALDDSLALVLALAADLPRQPEAGPPAAAPPAPGSTSRLRSLDTPLSIPDTTYAPRLSLALRPSVGVSAALGLIPSLALGLELGVELRFNQFWPITLHGAGFGERRQQATEPSKGARFTAQTLALGVCPWTGQLGGLEASVCVAQRLGRVSARGVGFDQPQRDDGWTLGVGAGLGLSRSFGPWFAGFAGTLLVPVVRRRYFFTDDVDVTLFEQPWLGGLLALRVGTEI